MVELRLLTNSDVKGCDGAVDIEMLARFKCFFVNCWCAEARGDDFLSRRFVVLCSVGLTLITYFLYFLNTVTQFPIFFWMTFNQTIFHVCINIPCFLFLVFFDGWITAPSSIPKWVNLWYELENYKLIVGLYKQIHSWNVITMRKQPKL